MGLPNTGMSFTPFDPLPASDLNDLVENIEALAAGTGFNAGAVGPEDRSGGFFIGSFTVSATGNKVITGVGFTPKLVKFIDIVNAATTGAQGGIGAMTSTAQYAHAWNADGAAGARYSSTSKCFAVVGASSSTPVQLASYVSMDSDGFTINFSAQNGNPVGFEAYA